MVEISQVCWQIHQKDPKLIPPPILHGVPIGHDKMCLLLNEEGIAEDPHATLYPGDQLPDHILLLLTNTIKGKDWSCCLWANVFAAVVFAFLQNHKGGIIKRRKEFCMQALHPSNPVYHMFHQDYFFDDLGTQQVPYQRETYLKTAWKTTFDAIFRYVPRKEDNGWDVTKVCDPKKLFKLDNTELV
jgi:hypothetical protein